MVLLLRVMALPLMVVRTIRITVVRQVMRRIVAEIGMALIALQIILEVLQRYVILVAIITIRRFGEAVKNGLLRGVLILTLILCVFAS